MRRLPSTTPFAQILRRICGGEGGEGKKGELHWHWGHAGSEERTTKHRGRRHGLCKRGKVKEETEDAERRHGGERDQTVKGECVDTVSNRHGSQAVEPNFDRTK